MMNSEKLYPENGSDRNRKLVAIMFTDMVGYSALAQRNEALALDLLEEHRNLLRPLFPKHGGKEVETVGDAFFVEFKSALEAVRCAIEIQRILFERNSKIESEKHIKLRIGLHVGDVISMGKHVHGDGVNIAARLEPLSKPGGICLSGDVARQIHNKIDFPLTKLRLEKLKNIQVPVDVHHILLPWEDEQKRERKSIFRKSTDKKFIIYSGMTFAVLMAIFILWYSMPTATNTERNNRIAVLPLVNISENEEDEYFADGMTEELISKLAKIRGLKVIARTSVEKYKDTQLNIEEIGAELNVGTILEGSVRKTYEKARIMVQLIDVKTQEHLWTEEYNRDLKDIFAIQSGIALKIANELKIQLVAIEKQQIEKMGSNNTEAYRSYLLGKFYLKKRTESAILRSLEYFEDAINLDPAYALAYVGIADCYTLIGGAGYGSLQRDQVIRKAKDAINRAFELDGTLAEAYSSQAYINFRLEWNWLEAERNFKKTIELNPGYGAAYERYALFLALFGRYDEAIPMMQHAYELDPLSASVGTGIGRIYHFSRQFDKAIEQYKGILEMDPDYVEAVFGLGQSYIQKKMYKEGIFELKRAVELSNNRPIFIASLGCAYAMNGTRDKAETIARDLVHLQNERSVSPFYSAIVNAYLGNTNDAIKSLYKAYEKRSGLLVYMKASPMLDPLRNEPEFIKLLQQMGME
jgi:TolB-like protein/class 3 adenylate cyclase/Flp pilus assembly protein TadD